MSSDADFLRARMGKVRPLANGNKVTLSKRAVDRSAAWQQRQIDAQEHSVDTSRRERCRRRYPPELARARLRRFQLCPVARGPRHLRRRRN